jgi:probable phosphoglycerate mutase
VTRRPARPPASRRIVTVYVVRHGATEWNEQGRIVGRSDHGLSEVGRVQADGARRLLAGRAVDLALTSPLRRTRETADAVLAGRATSTDVEPRLTELALGDWEGMARAELGDDPRWRAWLAAPDASATPGGERLADVARRAGAALRDAVRRAPDRGGVALFTHGGVARVLSLSLLGMPLAAYHKLRCDCGSVSAFEVTPTGVLARALVLNLTEPLVALSGRPVG